MRVTGIQEQRGIASRDSLQRELSVQMTSGQQPADRTGNYECRSRSISPRPATSRRAREGADLRPRAADGHKGDPQLGPRGPREHFAKAAREDKAFAFGHMISAMETNRSSEGPSNTDAAESRPPPLLQSLGRGARVMLGTSRSAPVRCSGDRHQRCIENAQTDQVGQLNQVNSSKKVLGEGDPADQLECQITPADEEWSLV